MTDRSMLKKLDIWIDEWCCSCPDIGEKACLGCVIRAVANWSYELQGFFDEEEKRELENYRTKSLVVLLSSCTGPVAQKIINYELSVKSSSELARLGLAFLERGLNSGWEVSALSRMKNIASPKQKELIYKMDSSSFDLNDLIGMDRSILKPEDFQKVVDHENERTTKLDYIKDVIGKVMMSGLRERSKKTKSDAETKDFHKFINTLIAHNKNDMSGLSDDQLNSVYRLAKRLESMLPSIEAKCKSAEEADK